VAVRQDHTAALLLRVQVQVRPDHLAAVAVEVLRSQVEAAVEAAAAVVHPAAVEVEDN